MPMTADEAIRPERTSHELTRTYSPDGKRCDSCLRTISHAIYTLSRADGEATGDRLTGPVVCADCIALALAVLAEVEQEITVRHAWEDFWRQKHEHDFANEEAEQARVLEARLIRARAATSQAVAAAESAMLKTCNDCAHHAVHNDGSGFDDGCTCDAPDGNAHMDCCPFYHDMPNDEPIADAAAICQWFEEEE